jgi:hypothetical protein
MVPVTEQMCTMGELVRGELTLLHIRMIHDALAVRAENARRSREQ